MGVCKSGFLGNDVFIWRSQKGGSMLNHVRFGMVTSGTPIAQNQGHTNLGGCYTEVCAPHFTCAQLEVVFAIWRIVCIFFTLIVLLLASGCPG